ncbi:response regulator transcription factor [Blastococcus sp. CT_GayMR16]|uniref:response regulator transcription factor n=1 Tax=Blastococcus sp. CT_GayMR16 TaxID=2559607 RepID=UPI001073B1BD|nr:response regulator transcription factor [Blastococcus sp. CT_GayMR16]TFV88547.1 response regulator transcription factor [Blastococcus sp. CT_GayMR16]
MRVIVADDSAVIRAGVVRILASAGMDIVAEARTADELLTAVADHRPELCVVDIRMPPRDTAGLHAAVQIRDRYRGSVRVLVLSQYLEPDYALQLLGSGVGGMGYLLKDRVAEGGDLVEAAQRVGAGGTAIDPAVVEELVRARRRHDRLVRLTSRERRVLALVAEGRSNRAIADRLDVAVKTIEGVIAVVFAKLDLEPGPDANRRVLAVLVHLNHAQPATERPSAWG